MDEFQKFYVEWQERCRLIKEHASLYNFLTVFLFVMSGIAIFSSYLEYGLWFAITTILIVVICTLYIRHKFRIYTSFKYKDLLGNYIILVTKINENIPEACNKGYNKFFFEYGTFIGIEADMNEFDIIKKLRSFPRSKKQYTKSDFEEMTREYVKTRNLLREEGLKRHAESFKKNK